MFNFVKKIILFLITIVVATCFLNYFIIKIDNSDPDEISKFKNVPYEIKLCNFGSSHGRDAFTYDEIKGINTFNFALTSQLISYDFRVFKNYEEHISKGAYIIIPISYFSLLGELEEKTDDFLSKNKRYYSIIEKEYIKEYNFYYAFFVNLFPALINYERNASIIWHWLFNNNSDRDEKDFWHNVINDKNILEDAKAAALRHIVTNKKDKQGNFIINEYEINELSSFIQYCKNNGYKPVLVTIPYTKEYIDEIEKISNNFCKRFHDFLNELAEKNGVMYYDYSHDNRFVNNHNLFYNGDHMNYDGAKKFVDIIRNEVLK